MALSVQRDRTGFVISKSGQEGRGCLSLRDAEGEAAQHRRQRFDAAKFSRLHFASVEMLATIGI